MKNKKKTEQTAINPESWYTLVDITRGQMFPWVKSIITVRKMVDLDRANRNILKVSITGDGRAKKYRFKGENIIKFVNEFEAGKAKLKK